MLLVTIKFNNSVRSYYIQGSWKPGKHGDLNFICPGSEIAWNLSKKVRKPGQNKKFCRKPVSKPGMLRYTKFQYYIETIFSKFWIDAN